MEEKRDKKRRENLNALQKEMRKCRMIWRRLRKSFLLRSLHTERETIRKNKGIKERQSLLYGCDYFSRFSTAAAMDGVEKIVNRARRSFSEYSKWMRAASEEGGQAEK